MARQAMFDQQRTNLALEHFQIGRRLGRDGAEAVANKIKAATATASRMIVPLNFSRSSGMNYLARALWRVGTDGAKPVSVEW